ncbi:MAG: NADH-ubiquinone oxidoreductase-F iron-sulfur binding region domain-containing protein [Acidimicrobiales bacterium]
MTPSACAAPQETSHYQLLGHPTDLAGHLRTLGPLPMPAKSNREWKDWLLGAVHASGLSGRGGAGFPTSMKLDLARSVGGGVVVVNGMEGEPASHKDKVLLTRVPHLVLDGAQLMGAVCGANEVLVCVPAGRDTVADAVRVAIAERSAQSHGQRPEVVVRPPDRFVAGEESALAQWINTGWSLPSFRPDKGVSLRIGRRRALVHNAETLAHVGLIARRGPEAFRSRGMSEEPGTTLVTVSGAVARPGVVEVDRGTPLQDIVARAVPVDTIGAMLVGGYGGTWVGPQDFGTPYASISLRTIGASAGVGVVVALSAAACGIAESARIAHYMAGQSAGQCGPCVHGLPAIATDLTTLARGRPDPELTLRLLRRLHQVEGRGACRHPDGVVGMVRSALRVFATDVSAHLRGAPCPWNDASQLHVPPGTSG